MIKPNIKATAIYVRVSTFDQDAGLASQEKALRDYCQNHGFTNIKWYRDKMTGSTTDRPGFNQLQADVFKGRIGTVIVWKLDRLSRSLSDGIKILSDWLKDHNIRVIAITQQLDFSGSMGQIIASLLFGLAQMERENLRENTKRGMAAAKAKGIRLGKRPTIFAKDIIAMQQSGMTVSQIAEKLNKSKQAIYKALKRG
jgi:DNA invertase Pin-like site-specific DNA recombinase